MSPHFSASPRAAIHDTASIGPSSQIGRDVIVHPHVTIGRSCRVGADSMVGESSWIGDCVIIGPRVHIGRDALILAGARICPNRVRSVSSDGRKLRTGVTVAAHVLLHDEVELGENTIVPSQRTIASLGNFGSKNRVVTIYGSDAGPRFSIGCQVGVTWESIKANIASNLYTSRESADTYVSFLPVFNEIGAVVQNAYDREPNLVAELLAMRQAHGMTCT